MAELTKEQGIADILRLSSAVIKFMDSCEYTRLSNFAIAVESLIAVETQSEQLSEKALHTRQTLIDFCKEFDIR